jgi:CheY-like chemotaxis protein
MARPTFLLAEPEPDQALSVRKLVLESAKYNVLTAHSGREALDLFHMFPNVSAVVLHSQIRDMDCETVLRNVKGKVPDAMTIFLSAGVAAQCQGADHRVSSHDPEALLNLLRRLFGDPRTEIDKPAQPKLVG